MHRRSRLAVGVLAVGTAMVFATTAFTYSASRTSYAGNKTCGDFGYAAGFKIDRQNPNGTYSDGTHTVTITLHSNTNPISFDFTNANPAPVSVLVKAGNGGYVYQYGPHGVTGDTGLESPMPDQISHLDFCYGMPPTAVGLKAFDARPTASGVVVRWRTSSEGGMLGFNIYREIAGKRVKLNRALIRAGSDTRGHTYAWVDRTGVGHTRYWVQEVSLRGVRTWHGPARS